MVSERWKWLCDLAQFATTTKANCVPCAKMPLSPYFMGVSVGTASQKTCAKMCQNINWE